MPRIRKKEIYKLVSNRLNIKTEIMKAKSNHMSISVRSSCFLLLLSKYFTNQIINRYIDLSTEETTVCFLYTPN